MLFFIGLTFIYLFITGFKKYKKVILIFIILSIVLLGLSSIRLLPLLDFSKASDLGGERPFEAARGYYIKSDGLLDITTQIVRAFTTETSLEWSDELQIGIITFLLALLALPLIKNRYVLFFIIAILVLSNVATGSHLFYFLWKFFPGFNKQHHIIRVMHLVPFCFSVLAGFGASFLFGNIVGKIKKKNVVNIIFFAFFILLLFELPYKTPTHDFIKINMDEQIYSNKLMVYLSEAGKEDLFRVHRWGLFNHIGGGDQSLWIPMGISTVHGNLNTFEAEYLFQFVNPVAYSNPTKILGIYNTKYFYSDENLTSPNLVFVKEFKERCNQSIKPSICNENWGPYLYLNKRYVPRAYIVDNAVLIIGEKQNAANAMYSLILEDNFNPSNLAIVTMEVNEVNKYDIDFFSRFNAIILLNRPKGDLSTLKQYSDQGGKLLPDIFKGESSLSQEQIDSLLKSYSSNYNKIKKIDVVDYKSNSMKIRLNEDSGFVVIAEKYFMYEGWHANDDRKILRTNGFSSGVFVNENDSELEFTYFPRSFKIGMTITLITLLAIITYFVIRFAKHKSYQKV